MPHPTQIVSALADPARLALYARVVEAGPGGVSAEEAGAGGGRARRHLARLADAELLRVREGRVVAVPEVFASAMEEHRPVGHDPVDTLFHDGRLTTLPARHGLRRKVFERITDRLFAPGTKYTEKQVNAALLSCYDDPSSMRRYLVDGGYLTRNAEGSVYRVANA